MYTRSFPSRRMPPDYSGTALVVKKPEENYTGSFNDIDSQSDFRPRRTLISKSPSRPTPPISAPFGISGQNDAEEISVIPSTEEELDIASEPEVPAHNSYFEPQNLKSDDLLLLGIALMLLYSKDESGNIPLNALLILAMIYLSGL